MYAAGKGLFRSPYGRMDVTKLQLWAFMTRFGPLGLIKASSDTPVGKISYVAYATCLSVSGNHAVLGGKIFRGSIEGGGQGVVLFIEDNGRHDPGQNGPDKIIGRSVPVAPTTCPAYEGSSVAPFDGELLVGPTPSENWDLAN
jgi:hypothetical protein